MEKKKLLLVAVSVGVVLLIIIGIPLLALAPKSHPAPTSLAMSPEQAVYTPSLNQDNSLALNSEIPDVEPLFNEPLDIPYYADYTAPVEIAIPSQSAGAPAVSRTVPPQSAGAPAVSRTVPPQSAGTPAASRTVPRMAAEAPGVTTITIAPPETAAVPNTPPARTSSQTKQTTPVKLTPAAATVAAKPAPAKETAPKAPATVTPAAAVTTKPAAKPAPAKTNNNYWVQTGAFSTKVRAEGAKESLASKGITSIIDNRDIDGKTWYRVRVGPYTSETEANYWLALVKSIDGFAESQIRQTPIAH